MDPLDADFILELNVDNPMKNLLVVPFRAPMCPEVLLKANTTKGMVDKLIINAGIEDLRDTSKFLLWLHREGIGMFLRVPAAPSFMLSDSEDFFNLETDPNQPFKPRCGFTWERYSAFVDKLGEEDNHVTIFFEFPPGIVCSNSHFNKDTEDIDPSNQFELINR